MMDWASLKGDVCHFGNIIRKCLITARPQHVNVVNHIGTLLTQFTWLMGSVWGPSLYTHPGRGFLYVSSVRVPDDSDSKSGVIKQRQNCLESQRVEGQELPVLTLAPCVGSQGGNAIKQVKWPEKGQSALATNITLVNLWLKLAKNCVCYHLCH